MTGTSRREKVETMLLQEPGDQFLRYTLAMELAKEGQHDRSQEVFRSLMGDVPPHVPSFFMAAQNLTRHGDIDTARSVLRSGIEEARRQGNSHAAGEMSELLASLGSLGELP